MADHDLRELLIKMLVAENAHVSFENAVDGLSPDKRGSRVDGIAHTPWQLVEHLRIAQWDIIEFSRNPDHVSPDWPDGYWPGSNAPPSDDAWGKSVAAFQRDLKELEAMIADESKDLLAPFPHGDGQNLLRQAILTIKHNSYHIGQLAMLRNALANRS